MIRPRLTLTTQQMAAILGLENVLQASALILTCPFCAQEGHAQLDTDNTRDATEWKIDCSCRERRFLKTAVKAMDADGALMAAADQILAPIRLAVRCGQSRCLLHPLDVEHTPTHTILRCRCAKTTLRLLSQTAH
jgi:hypothetical protein